MKADLLAEMDEAAAAQAAREAAVVAAAVKADLDADKENRDPFLATLASGDGPPGGPAAPPKKPKQRKGLKSTRKMLKSSKKAGYDKENFGQENGGGLATQRTARPKSKGLAGENQRGSSLERERRESNGLSLSAAAAVASSLNLPAECYDNAVRGLVHQLPIVV